MGRVFNSDAVDTSPRPIFSTGLLQVRFESAKEGDFDGKLIYDVRMTIIKSAEPNDEGKTWFERIFVGTDEDPTADDVVTQRKSYGLKLLKLMCEKCEVSFAQDMDMVFVELEGKEFLARNKTRTTDGTTYNGLSWVFALGEREVGADAPRGKRVTNGSGKPAASRPAPAAQPAGFGAVQEIEE